jgi:hypothetical protein
MKIKNASKNILKAQTGFGLCVFNLRKKSLISSVCAIYKLQAAKQ